MAEPIVTVIIPTRNRLLLLQEAVASVQAQTLQDWELIVVDDASEDATWTWLQTIAGPRIRPIRLEKHSERSAARNAGLAEAGGEFVLFLDDDDRLRPRALERLLAALTRHLDAIAAVGARCYFGDVPREWRPSHPHVTLKRQVWPDVMFGWCPGQGAALIQRRELDRVGGYNSEMARAEDHHLWLRLSAAGPVVLVPHVVVDVRVHPARAPHESHPLVDQVRQAQIERLRGPEREHALRVLAARSLWLRASAALARGRYRAALADLFRAVLAAPEILGSPLVGPVVCLAAMRAAFGCVFGDRGVGIARRLKGRLTRRCGLRARGAAVP
ncbi:MAG: glycosyltransferase family 2 protein [candidate division NC10 bacterium]|nr:glycosyltransferase family 2 protein [candidate division NC10 bacterium]